VEPEPHVTELAGGHLTARAARIAAIVAKHGLKAVSEDDASRPARLRAALEELGPTFCKLGQMLSTRPDLIPPELADELASLQDRVPPLTEAEVVQVMEEELGVPWEDVFESIEPTPLAAGTIGQVHRARLEGGERVVLKVQRPGAAEEIERDLGLFALFAEKAEGREALAGLVDIPAVVEHLSSSLRRELDFREEAANIERMREVLAQFPRLAVPWVHSRLSSRRLLVMEEIQGGPLRDAPPGDERREAARQLLEAYYRQVLTEGFFHADPHPGNLLWADGRIYLLDLGMVGTLDDDTRGLLLLLLLAFWREDSEFLADVLLMLGEGGRDVDLDGLRDDLAAYVGLFKVGSFSDIQLGPMLDSLMEIAARHGIRLPASLAMTGKAFSQMQLAVAELDPTLDPFSAVGGFMFRGLRERVGGALDPQRAIYELQKLKLRTTRLIEGVERLTGARPGPGLQIELRGSRTLEDAIRRAGRRIALAFAGGATLLAAVLAAAASSIDLWVPITLGVAAGVAGIALVLDLVNRR
jgi:predicted unusual protein kinase regulating ubiquinone biosynthesis (AarF/ABC1/UbiB family)